MIKNKENKGYTEVGKKKGKKRKASNKPAPKKKQKTSHKKKVVPKKKVKKKKKKTKAELLEEEVRDSIGEDGKMFTFVAFKSPQHNFAQKYVDNFYPKSGPRPRGDGHTKTVISSFDNQKVFVFLF